MQLLGMYFPLIYFCQNAAYPAPEPMKKNNLNSEDFESYKGQDIGNNSETSSEVYQYGNTCNQVSSKGKKKTNGKYSQETIITKIQARLRIYIAIKTIKALLKEQEKESTKVYEDGSTYKGKIFFSFNMKGILRNGKRESYGVLAYQDGSKYEGYWKNDQKSGKGKLISSNGNVYEGDWENDAANGKGVLVSQNGGRYEGFWKDDLQEGEGKEMFPDNSCYEGNYSQGLKNGKGIMKWPDGTSYEGDWLNNVIEGQVKNMFLKTKIGNV